MVGLRGASTQTSLAVGDIPGMWLMEGGSALITRFALMEGGGDMEPCGGGHQ